MAQVDRQKVLSLYRNLLKESRRWPLTPERKGRDLAERIPAMVRDAFKKNSTASGEETQKLVGYGESVLCDMKSILKDEFKTKYARKEDVGYSKITAEQFKDLLSTNNQNNIKAGGFFARLFTK
eukprot:Nk52_evm14s265 gene=Nk52_evmTU14s265